eukprot:scaffold154446_cov20-Prasinocladus_malaysianus.AAC.1
MAMHSWLRLHQLVSLLRLNVGFAPLLVCDSAVVVATFANSHIRSAMPIHLTYVTLRPRHKA